MHVDDTQRSDIRPSAHLTIADAPAPSRDGTLLPGTRVHRYTVLKTLARGGMGIVYVAYDEELDRRVALKLLSPTQKDDSGAQRLLREAQAMAKLSHENVVTVYDVGTFESQVFLAMEFVDGITLRAWRGVQNRSASEIVAMYVQAGRGLAAAHAAGILHRDFKPENVLVDAAGRARVLDFGVARIDPTAAPLDEGFGDTQVDDPQHAALTRVGTLVGTPGYMAPEQLRGERAEARSDVFGFAVAIYEALYGERPFAGRTVRERLDAIQAERTLPPPRGARVPGAVRAALLRGVRAKPDDRWPTLDAMLDALERAVRAPRRRLVVGALFGVAALCAGALLLRPSRPAPCAGVEHGIDAAWGPGRRDATRATFLASANPRAQATWDRVRTLLDAYAASWSRAALDSCQATRVRGVQSDDAFALRAACLTQRRDELASTADLLAQADSNRVDDAVTMAVKLTDVSSCADVSALRGAFAAPADPAKRSAIEGVRREVARGTALVNARQLDEAISVLSHAAQEAKAASDRQLEAAALVLTGRAQIGRGEAKDAAKTLFDAAVEANVVRDATTEASAWVWLVRAVGYDLGELERSQRYARFAEPALERAGHPPALEADLLRHRAHALWAHGDVAASLPLYQQSRELRVRAFGAESPLVAELEVNLADIRGRQGEPREAIPLYETALQKRIAAYGEGNTGAALILSDLSIDYLVVGRSSDALAAARRALAISRPGESLRATIRLDEALARIGSNDVAGGLEEANDALREEEAQGGSVHLANAHESLAETLLYRHLMSDAERHADVAWKTFSSPDGDPVQRNDSTAVRAICHARAGRGRDALSEASPVVVAEEKASGPTSHRMLLPLVALGEAAMAASDPTTALAAFERASAVADHAEMYPELHADAHLGLARALLATHGDPARAQALAQQAAREYDETALPALSADARHLAAAVLVPR